MEQIAVSMSNEFKNLIVETKNNKTNDANTERDVIRRAVALYAFLHDQIEKSPKSKVCVMNENNQIILIIDPLP